MSWRSVSAPLAGALMLGMLFPAVTATASTGTCWRHKPSERRFARKINLARASAGRQKLRLDKQLTVVARRHAWEMKRRNDLYHTPDSTLGRRVTRWRVLGENVGVGESVKSLHRAFMASAPHRANALYSAYRYIGVGVTRGRGRMWVTIVFESAVDPGTPLRATARSC